MSRCCLLQHRDFPEKAKKFTFNRDFLFERLKSMYMNNYDSDSISALKNGDIKQFEKVFKTYYPLLCQYAVRFLKSDDEAEEIVQELFYSLWEKRNKLNIHTSLKAYLYKATYLNCLDRIRQEKRHYAHQNSIEINADEGYEDHALEAREVNLIIMETLEKLPERGKRIFQMSRFEGMKYQEIAEKLSISIKTVEANMGKALKFFRHNLKDYVGSILL